MDPYHLLFSAPCKECEEDAREDEARKKMIDVIQWRASIGLWNCCQCTAGPTRHSIRTESTPGRKKRKIGSLSLSPRLIALLLFLLILITGYLEYNPPSTGMNILRSSMQVV